LFKKKYFLRIYKIIEYFNIALKPSKYKLSLHGEKTEAKI